MHALQSSNLDLQQSTLGMMYDLTHDAPDVVGKHLDSIIPQLTKLASCPDSMVSNTLFQIPPTPLHPEVEN